MRVGIYKAYPQKDRIDGLFCDHNLLYVDLLYVIAFM